MRSKVWVVANVVMLLAFAFSVLVQVNDPDPLAWVTIYGLAAVGCALGMVRRGHWAFPALVGIAAAVWAAVIAPRVLGQVPFVDMFGAFEMENTGVEESREMYGLLIVAGWMAVVATVSGQRAQRS